jgi:hypothetical protein
MPPPLFTQTKNRIQQASLRFFAALLFALYYIVVPRGVKLALKNGGIIAGKRPIRAREVP